MALQRFVRRVAEAANGTGEAKDALAQMGIALRDQSGNLRRSEAPDRRPADSGAPGDLGDRQLLSRMENDPSPRPMLLGAVGDDRLQTSTILGRDHRADYLSHAASMAHLAALVNRLFASVL
jgi:hypothetical protein